MMQLVELFLKAGYKIHFGSTAGKTDYSEDLEALGISLHSIQLNHSSFDEQVQSINPSVVLYDRFMTEEQFGWRVREHCPATVIWSRDSRRGCPRSP